MNPFLLIAIIAVAVLLLTTILWYFTKRFNKNQDELRVPDIREWAYTPTQDVLRCPRCKCTQFNSYSSYLIRCYNCKTIYYDHGIFGIVEYKHPSNSNNPFDLRDGEVAILDEERNNASIVTIRTVTPKGIYASVTDGEDTWNVMTCRLSLPSFYVSFGQSHVINKVPVKDFYLEVKARSSEQVREFLEGLVGNQYAFIYPQIKKENYPKGRLALFIINKPIQKTVKS